MVRRLLRRFGESLRKRHLKHVCHLPRVFTGILVKRSFLWAGIPTKRNGSPPMQCQPRISGVATNTHERTSKNSHARNIGAFPGSTSHGAPISKIFPKSNTRPQPTTKLPRSSTPPRKSRRYWLDFVQWYYDSMTRFTGEVCRIARKHFPNALLELPVGGGSEDLMYGQDTTAIPKIAKRYNVHIRSTHGGFQPFAQNYAGMLKKIATPCKFYDVPHWLEPPGAISPDGEVSRIMEAISCGNYGFWDWGANPMTAADKFREYTNYFTREHPVVDVALFFPTTDHRLHPQTTFPQKLQTIGSELRDVMDFDMVENDEAL